MVCMCGVEGPGDWWAVSTTIGEAGWRLLGEGLGLEGESSRDQPLGGQTAGRETEGSRSRSASVLLPVRISSSASVPRP